MGVDHVLALQLRHGVRHVEGDPEASVLTPPLLQVDQLGKVSTRRGDEKDVHLGIHLSRPARRGSFLTPTHDFFAFSTTTTTLDPTTGLSAST